MHLRNLASDKAIDRLAAHETTADVVARLREEATRAKPAGYDRTLRDLVDCYERRQGPLMRRHLLERFPNAGEDLPIVVDNLVRQVCDTDGQAYSTAPDRWLELALDDGQRMPAGDVDGGRYDWRARQASLDEMLRRAQVASVLIEVDRRAVLPGDVWIRVRPIVPVDGDPKPLRLSLQLYWGHDVVARYEGGSPGDVDRATMIIAAGLDEEGRTVDEVWTRETFRRDDGSLEGFGPWHASIVPRVGKDGRPEGAERPLFGDGVCPLGRCLWLRYSAGEVGGHGYRDEGDELLAQQKAVNEEWSLSLRTDELAAYPRTVHAGDRQLPGRVKFGPGQIVSIGSGENLFELQPTTTMVGIDKVERLRRAVAASRRQPVDAYSLQGETQALSGVALRTYREPQAKALRERRQRLELWEQEQLLPVLAAAHDYWVDDPEDLIAHEPRVDETEAPVVEGLRFRCEWQPEDLVESEDEKLDRVIRKKDAGLLSPARAGVEAGIYDSEDEAVAAGLSPVIRSPVPTRSGDLPPLPAPTSGGGGLAALAAMAADPAVEAEDDDDGEA